jgi:hypothetical protein
MSTDDRRLNAALAYAKNQSWPVFALAKGSKVPPRGSHSFQDATTDPQAIRRAWARWPEANLGLDCGAAGLVVIDLDLKSQANGLDTWRGLKARYGLGDETVTSRTPSGGVHLIFRSPEGVVIRNSAGRLGPGVDVRGRGGYIVLPPSTIRGGAHSGRYVWAPGASPDECEAAPLPAPLVRLLADRPEGARWAAAARWWTGGNSPASAARRVERARHWLRAEAEAVARAQPGTRNDRLNRAAFFLARFVPGGFLDQAEVEEVLIRSGLACGLPRWEVARTLRNGLEAGLRGAATVQGGPSGAPARTERVAPAEAGRWGMRRGAPGPK